MQQASEEVKEAEMLHEKMSSVQKWMIKLQLPHDLRVKIRQYYGEVSNHRMPRMHAYRWPCLHSVHVLI